MGLDRYGVVHPGPALDEHHSVHAAVPHEVCDLALVVDQKREDLSAGFLCELRLT